MTRSPLNKGYWTTTPTPLEMTFDGHSCPALSKECECLLDALLEAAHSEMVAYAGMIMILTAFLLETRDVLHSKERTYLVLMALGSGLLAVRAYLIDEWAFFILEVAWFAAAALGLWSIGSAIGN